MKILQCPVCKGFSRHPDNWESLVICQECNLANQAQAKRKVVAVAVESLLAEPVSVNVDLKKPLQSGWQPLQRSAWLRPIKDH